MANQQPRPAWFRLSGIGRPMAPATAQQAPIRQTPIPRPTVTTGLPFTPIPPPSTDVQLAPPRSPFITPTPSEHTAAKPSSQMAASAPDSGPVSTTTPNAGQVTTVPNSLSKPFFTAPPKSSPTLTHVKSPTPSLQTSPVIKATTPITSPKTPEHNTIKPSSNLPSPFTLPPGQKIKDETEPKIPSEVEQKRVLVQETIEKPKNIPNSHDNAIDSSRRKDTILKDKSTNKKNSNLVKLGMRVITLAGENKGAVMEISPAQKKKYFSGNLQSLQNNKSTSIDQSNSDHDKEGKSNRNDKRINAETKDLSTSIFFMNNNVQGVNNSVLYNCNYRQNDPGIHLKKVNGKHAVDEQ